MKGRRRMGDGSMEMGRGFRLSNLRKGILALPDLERYALVLHWGVEMSCEEIARLLQLSPNAVATLTQAGLSRIERSQPPGAVLVEMLREAIFSGDRIPPHFDQRILERIRALEEIGSMGTQVVRRSGQGLARTFIK